MAVKFGIYVSGAFCNDADFADFITINKNDLVFFSKISGAKNDAFCFEIFHFNSLADLSEDIRELR